MEDWKLTAIDLLTNTRLDHIKRLIAGKFPPNTTPIPPPW